MKDKWVHLKYAEFQKSVLHLGRNIPQLLMWSWTKNNNINKTLNGSTGWKSATLT